VIFEHDKEDELKESKNVNTSNAKKPKRDTVALALWAFFFYNVYKMIKAGLKFAFAPVRVKRSR
jgi:hypothetical protein